MVPLVLTQSQRQQASTRKVSLLTRSKSTRHWMPSLKIRRLRLDRQPPRPNPNPDFTTSALRYNITTGAKQLRVIQIATVPRLSYPLLLPQNGTSPANRNQRVSFDFSPCAYRQSHAPGRKPGLAANKPRLWQSVCHS